MKYYVSNLTDDSIIIGYAKLEALETKKVTEDFVVTNWILLESLQNTDVICISSEE